MTATQAPSFPPRYEPVAALGKGGAGEVWAVRDRITGRIVALKALGEGGDEREVMALVREAAALSGVEGLGVPRVLRFGRLPGTGRPYLVRELVEGTSLADLLERGAKAGAEASGESLNDPALDPAAWLDAIADAADQLTRLHRALLLHGDVKPANLIVSPDRRATLVDLGLAAPWREGGVRPEGLTPRYAAPELFEGAPLTVRVEVFALGATLEEALLAAGDRIAPEARRALTAVVARATAEDPAERYPSVDELGSALRRAAGLAERPPPDEVGEDDGAAVWPVVGLDGPSSRLLARIEALRDGGGLLITGPAGSGRSALLRRIAWSLGVAGRAVAWIEAARIADPAEALGIELADQDPGRVIVLVDDAERVGEADLRRLDAVREAGGKLILVLGVAPAAGQGLPGRTFEIFPMEPLDPVLALELVQRVIPSLSDAVAEHVVARGGGWPGRIRGIVARLARAPVASSADVDRLLDEGAPRPSAPGAAPRRPVEEVHALLDRGHFDEAAEALAAWAEDRAPEVAIARARLLTNQGDAARALAELSSVGEAVERAGDVELGAFWSLHVARALLRAGDYAGAERRAAEVAERLGARELLAGEGSDAPITERGLQILAEAAAMQGLSQSFASRHEEARATLERAVGLARRARDPRSLSVALGSLAFALQRDERLVEAKSAYEEALSAAEQAGDAGTMATTRLNLAGIAKLTGDLAAAIRHLEAAVDMGRRSGRMATLRQALLNLANLELYIGRIAKAGVSIDALAAERAALAPQQRAQLLALEAEHAARSGDPGRATQLCAACGEAYEAMGRRVDAVEARLERALLLVGLPGADARAISAEVEAAASDLGSSGAHRALLALARGRAAALAHDEERARAAYEEALAAARAAGQRDWIWRAVAARAELEDESGQALRARRDREEALATLEEIASRLPRDLREVFWNDPRRRELRAAARLALMNGPTSSAPVPPGEDRLARVLEINRAIAGEHDLDRLLGKVTDHAIALLRAERGFVILQSGYARRGARAAGEAAAPAPASASVSVSAPRPDGDLSIHASRDQAGDDPHARFSRSIADKVISTGEPVVTASARDDARMADYVSVHQLMLQSVACVPIRARGGAVIGALYLETRLRPTASFSGELPILIALADQVAIAIETARLVGENRRRAEELARANEELFAARAKLEELLGQRTAELAATRRDLRSARAVLRGHFGYEGLVGTSDAMRRMYALIDRVKDTDVPVLITGESGTGKEVVARTIHEKSPRGKKPFLGINCGAIPEHLLESELFGHVRGAFTGADRDRKGLFREATEGTVLLDEIGEMPPKMQAGLLRVLQERVVRPVGGAREERVETRVIAATHRDLAEMVERSAFREDLYYRLHVVEIRIPSLRERLDDVPLLIDHFLGIFAARYGRDRRSVSRAALTRLMEYHWPGNVRQLENVLLNAWVLSDTPELDVDDFELPEVAPRSGRSFPAPADLARGGAGAAASTARRPGPAPSRPDSAATPLEQHRDEERARILAALTACNWNRVKAAEVVGMPRRTFYRRLKEYGIQ